MTRKAALYWKIGISGLAIVLVVVRVIELKTLAAWFDATFLLLVSAPILAFLVPWHRLQAFKAAEA